MKTTTIGLLCCILLLLNACNTTQKNQTPTWLVGQWERINDTPPKKTFEHWNTSLHGLGFSLVAQDTVFKEHLKIVNTKEGTFLEIEGVHDEPVLFKFTQQNSTSFTCENNKNEFPKKIVYSLENDTLKAQISADSLVVDFWFKRSL